MRGRLAGILRSLAEAGPEDRVFLSLLLLGPLVVALLAVAGRSTVTVGIVAAYVGSLPAYVLYRSRR